MMTNENLIHYFMLFPCLAQDLQQQLGGGGGQLSWKGAGDGGEGALARHRPGLEIILNWIL